MDELIAFLRACLAEEEALARRGDLRSPDLALRLDDDLYWISATPVRVLAEIAAKRHTLVRCQEEMLSGGPRLVHFAKQTVWEMSAPYAGHPGYKLSWTKGYPD